MISFDLSGTWRLRLDPDDVGMTERWFATSFDETTEVRLPGSLDENGVGSPNPDQEYLGGLSRKVKYEGAAWYQRVFKVPVEAHGTTLRLRLERVHWFSELWVNGVRVGECDSLSVAHEYDLSAFADAAELTLTLKVDNTPRIPIGRICHALTDWTQTNWNGVIGEIALQSTPTISDVRIEILEGGLQVRGRAEVGAPVRLSVGEQVTVLDEGGEFCARLPISKAWGEGSPYLETLRIETSSEAIETVTGTRVVSVNGKSIFLNGRPIFLRGTLENCVFPRTGYPPMDVPSWEYVMERAKAFGLNHLRFHSWCPPEAAFVAADRAGMLLQVELPLWTGLWSVSSEPTLLDFCRREAHRILSAYGHHPSFVLFTLGNEISFYGEEPEIDRLLEELKTAYPNRLYNFSSHGTHLSPVCDYFVQADNGKPGAENLPLRGSTWFGVGSRFDRERPNTLVTCDAASAQFDRPVISHEVAEWTVFPDVHHESRYDGVQEARNFRTIRRMLRDKGMEDQAPDFVRASGKLSSLLYKEEIETLLRTKGIAGYQLLGLTDFPGQGTATIGMLDAFWQDKGFVTGDEFRRYCAPTVPLLAFEKAVWSNHESYSAEVSAFHSGDPIDVEIVWRVVDASGSVRQCGTFGRHRLAPMGATAVGRLEIALESYPCPSTWKVVVEAVGIGENDWPFWVMPAEIEEAPLDGIHVARFYREDVRQRLKAGQDVWLQLNPNSMWSGIPGRFAPAFWSPVHFKEQVGTIGTVIDAKHPVFAHFPTEDHTEWHWWDVLTASKAVVLDRLPTSFRPTLQVIDRFERNHKLGTIWEARVGRARLFATVIDFQKMQDRPASRQLFASIRKYLASPSFSPSQTLTIADLDATFATEP